MPQEVIIQHARHSLTVEDGESVLDAALRAGLNLSHSCRGGTCTACRARLLAGRVTYPAGPPAGLSREEMDQGFVLLCQARPLETCRVEALEIKRSDEIEVKRLPCRIERMSRLNHDVMGVHLRVPSVDPLTFLPGQYVDILLTDGRRRSFSLASTPEQDLLEIHIRRVPGGGFTEFVFSELQPKSLLRIEGPLGAFYLRESERPALFVAGGTGYAPVKSMLADAIGRGTTRAMHLYWGVRADRDLYDLESLADWTDNSPGFRFTPVLSAPRDADRWPGRVGLVHTAVLEDHSDLREFTVYASGPPAMVEAARREFGARGLPDGEFFFDAFEYAPDTLAALRQDPVRERV